MKFLLVTFSFLFSLSGNASYKYIIDGNNEQVSITHRGMDGKDGDDAFRCEDGEDGQDGYNGGDVTLYFKSYTDLKNVSLDLTGGDGGKGGRAPMFTSDCDQYSYNKGEDGRDGSFGNIKLVQNIQKLPKVQTSKRLSLKELTSNTVDLSKNIFENKKGAYSLFAKNSKISNYFQEYTQTKRSQIETLSLLGSISKLQNETKLNYHLGRNGLNISSRDALINYDVRPSHNGYQVKILDLVPRAELNKLEFIKAEGSNKSLTLIFKDETLNKNLQNTYSAFFYHYSEFINWYVMLGTYGISQELVTTKGNLVFINIGKITKLTEKFEPGQKFKIRLSNYKSLKTNSNSKVGITREVQITIK